MKMNFKCVTILAILSAIQVKGQLYLARVIQGTAARIEQYPIVAQLLLDPWGTKQFEQYCAGAILTARHVISAAHCFQYNANNGINYALPIFWRVRVGSTYRSRGGTIYNINSIITHPNFDRSIYNNDIAVVVLARRLVFNNFVRQGTLISQGVDVMPNSMTELVGWGVTEVNGQQPDQLQRTTLFTVDQNLCRERYSVIQGTLTNAMLCAGRLDIGGADGCYGDSGGPLLYRGLVVGLVSFGYSCGNSFYPGVYTKISHFTDWIIKTIVANKL